MFRESILHKCLKADRARAVFVRQVKTNMWSIGTGGKADMSRGGALP